MDKMIEYGDILEKLKSLSYLLIKLVQKYENCTSVTLTKFKYFEAVLLEEEIDRRNSSIQPTVKKIRVWVVSC